MRAVIQRVTSATVTIEGAVTATIGVGLLVLLGVADDDTTDDAEWLAAKIARLRIFSDNEGLMNNDVTVANGDVLVVSQFTLHASYKKGNRPSFLKAAKPEIAIPLYEEFVKVVGQLIQKAVQTGVFGANMQVALVNDGPVSIIMDSHNRE